MARKHRFDQLKREYAEALGYNTHYVWECQWNNFLRQHPEQRQRIKDKQTLKYEGPAWTEGEKQAEVDEPPIPYHRAADFTTALVRPQ